MKQLAFAAPTGRRVNLDGKQDRRNPGIVYLGEAVEFFDGTWRCLADVGGSLCLVEVMITEYEDWVAEEVENSRQKIIDQRRVEDGQAASEIKPVEVFYSLHSSQVGRGPVEQSEISYAGYSRQNIEEK